ncbi:hypothetical protein B0H14DRAFT_2811717, partial [Mycena olivaceomarginata]
VGGAGLTFYAFKELRSAKPATQGEMKRIKDWFRVGMNAGAGDNVEVKAKPRSWRRRPVSSSSPARSSRPSTSRSAPRRSSMTPDAPQTYSLASVSAVVIAVCAAHFLLTVGGFTGEKGYEKLIAV